MREIIMDSLVDSVRLLPFLFITYLIMEWIEHKSGLRTNRLAGRRGAGGVCLGAILGLLPQCGFSASAAGLYAGRMISMGTLIAVFLSTSDEMLPIFISERAPLSMIGGILLCKAVVAVAVGIVVDLVRRLLKQGATENSIHSLCEKEHCHCENGIVRSALHHTLHIGLFVLLVTLALNAGIYLVGEEVLAGWILDRPLLGPLIAGAVGLIPNCAASVMLTQLYLQGMLSLGSMLAGLAAGSGIGLLVLFKVNSNQKENMAILGILYATGVAVGIAADLLLTLR